MTEVSATGWRHSKLMRWVFLQMMRFSKLMKSSCRMRIKGVDCSRTEERKILNWDLPGMGVFEAAQE